MHRYIYFSLPHFQVYDGIKICSYAGIGNSTIRYLTMHNIRKKKLSRYSDKFQLLQDVWEKEPGTGLHWHPGFSPEAWTRIISLTL